VAIVRPGPIQGDMVHPYLRRREGKEPVSYPKPELEKVLGKTLGVPLFQEQAMRVAIACAGFTPGEADQLRRAMATFKFTGGVSHFKDKLVGGMVERGYPRPSPSRPSASWKGLAPTAFPKATPPASPCWPMPRPGSNAITRRCSARPAQQPADGLLPARPDRPRRPSSMASRFARSASTPRAGTARWRKSPTGSLAVRLGLRMVGGLAEADAARLVLARAETPYRSIDDVWRRAGIKTGALSRLAEADAFQPSLKLARREAGLGDQGPARHRPAAVRPARARPNSTSRRRG
jgi:error-prone DNA polymerase